MNKTINEIEMMKAKLYQAFAEVSSRCEASADVTSADADAMGLLASGYAALVRAEPIAAAKYERQCEEEAFDQECRDERTKLETNLNMRYAAEIVELDQKQAAERERLGADAGAPELKKRHLAEHDRMRADHAADLERRMEELRHAQALRKSYIRKIEMRERTR